MERTRKENDMQVLILVITITWSFGGGYQNSPVSQIVDSPEAAAILVYNDRPSSFQVEPDRKTYTLYEMDFEKGTAKAVPIPEIIFQKAKVKDKK